MLGHSKHEAQVKSTRTQSDAVNVTIQKIVVPMTIRQFYNNVELSVDVMFVNKVPFLTSRSEYFHNDTVRAVENFK